MSRAHAMKDGFPPHEDPTADAMLRLSERTNIAPRVNEILQGLLALCVTGLELRISETLNEFEKQLIRLADKATIYQQNQYFDSVHALKRARADLAPRFLRSLENSLARLGEQTQCGARAGTTAAAKLALADGTQLDESLVLSDIATRVELRVREPLYTLGHRFGVLASTPRMPADSMPLGPRALTEALRYAAAELDVPLEHRLVLYRCFERVVMNEIGAFYGALNNFFVDKGVLPNLHVLPTTTTSPHAGELAQSQRPPAQADPRETKSASISRLPSTEPPRAPAPRETARAGDNFGALKQLLAECRHAEGYAADSAALQSVLAALQVQHAATPGDGQPTIRSGDQLKQEILRVLQERSADGRAPRIDEDDADAIDLVAMLFQFLSRRVQADGLANAILGKLQIPIVRAALADKAFFSERAHSARVLLNALVDAARLWVDEAEAQSDPTLIAKLKLVTNQVAAEYQGNALVFTSALQELSHYLETLRQNSAAAERRHVEAAIGREKLEYAKLLASAAISERVSANRPNEFLCTLLERAWVDVLAMGLLRDGEGSGSHALRLEVVDQLLAAASKPAQEPLRALSAEVRNEIEVGLTEIGLQAEDIRAILQRLLADAGHEQEDNPISQTELLIKLKGRARIGAEKQTGMAADAAAAKPLALTSQEQQVLDRLQTLPADTWFEFNANAAGGAGRRKLAWYSTHSGRCLLVNQRGTPREQTLAQLARDVAGGHARIASAEQEPLIDRALADIGDTLKNFSTAKRAHRFDVPPLQDLALPAQNAQPLANGSVPQAQERRTLLLVDDEENILRAFNRILRGEGYRILTATNAREALAILGQQPVQVIVSDQRMPEVSGTELLNKVKAIYPNTVRILFSGYSDVAAVTDAINRGVVYKFLTKPWNDDDIRLQLREAFHAAEVN